MIQSTESSIGDSLAFDLISTELVTGKQIGRSGPYDWLFNATSILDVADDGSQIASQAATTCWGQTSKIRIESLPDFRTIQTLTLDATGSPYGRFGYLHESIVLNTVVMTNRQSEGSVLEKWSIRSGRLSARYGSYRVLWGFQSAYAMGYIFWAGAWYLWCGTPNKASFSVVATMLASVCLTTDLSIQLIELLIDFSWALTAKSVPPFLAGILATVSVAFRNRLFLLLSGLALLSLTFLHCYENISAQICWSRWEVHFFLEVFLLVLITIRAWGIQRTNLNHRIRTKTQD